MGIFGFYKQPGINRGVKEFIANPGSILLDVRTPGEYRSGHIPGSKNIPLQELNETAFYADNKDVPIYVYCRSGVRSREAAGVLHRIGYANVKNLGGITRYAGKLEGYGTE